MNYSDYWSKTKFIHHPAKPSSLRTISQVHKDNTSTSTPNRTVSSSDYQSMPQTQNLYIIQQNHHIFGLSVKYTKTTLPHQTAEPSTLRTITLPHQPPTGPSALRTISQCHKHKTYTSSSKTIISSDYQSSTQRQHSHIKQQNHHPQHIYQTSSSKVLLSVMSATVRI